MKKFLYTFKTSEGLLKVKASTLSQAIKAAQLGHVTSYNRQEAV